MICVDNNRIRTRVGNVFGSWSHLFSDIDDRAELVAFAKKLGLKPEWIQTRNNFPTVHFDVVEKKRLLAIKLGATPITIRDYGKLIAANREAV